MHLIDELPYRTTKISVEQTQVDIIKLMSKYGISGYQWTSYNGRTALKFMLENKPYMVEVPRIQAIKKTRYKESIVDVDPKICFRLFYWALKSILEINTFGILNQLLLPYQIIKTDEGFKTIADTIQESPHYLLPEGEETF